MKFFGRQRHHPKPISEKEQALLQMIEQTQAVIYFKPDGTIIHANENFQAALGYEFQEIHGQKHSMFVDSSYGQSTEYRQFWQDLRDGKSFTDQFPRLRKDGTTIWIQATYAPVINAAGEISQVIKIASDVTDRKAGINSVASGLNALKDGDLSFRLAPSELPDIQLLVAAFNDALERLQFLVSQVKTANLTINQGSDRMRQSSDQLSKRTETQAATLEQTAAAIEQLTSNASAAAENARNVDDIASNTRLAAQDSGQVVADTTEAMGRIETSAGEISQIITVIDDLAFQTNLLSLNAGVEAARAGEAGRGFAVVATEVRALAQRSADSARDITKLINESTGHVSDGVELVERTSRQLNRIFDEVGVISSNIKEISGSLIQQSSTLSQINSAVAELDHVTQSNASMVLETTDISKSLQEDSQTLSDQVASFHTGESDSAFCTRHTDMPRQSIAS